MIVEQIEKLIGGTSYFSLDSGRASSHDEPENLGFGDIAVLYRLNAQGDAFEEAFSRAGIPFVRSGEKPLISQYPVNILWRFLQTRLYPENPYYLEAYNSCLRQTGLSSPLMREDERGEVPDISTLIEHALSIHQFGTLSEKAFSAINRLKAVAEDFTDMES